MGPGQLSVCHVMRRVTDAWVGARAARGCKAEFSECVGRNAGF